MEIKTKFNKKDKVVFLTANPDHLGDQNWYPEEDEIFICEGTVSAIKVDIRNDKVNIIYSVIVYGRSGNKWVDVHETMLASCIKQLGIDVPMYRINKRK